MSGSKIDIAELAELLEDRKNNNPKIALILGSRAGALSRSHSFADDMVVYSHAPRSFADMNEKRFSTCYSLLKEAKKLNGRKDVEILLNQKIREVDFSIADDCLAELVKQRIFKVILSSNPDDVLYDALNASGLKKNEDFVDFDFDRYRVGEIHEHDKINACKVIKFFNNVDTFMHRLDKQQELDKISQNVKNLLEQMWIKEVLVVGIDLAWDHIILSALPPRIKTIWFINEDEQAKEKFLTTYQGVGEFKFLTGRQGGYEKFLTALYSQINPGMPPRRYELTSQLQKQFDVMQRGLQSDLMNINNRLRSLEEYSRGQASIDTLKNTEKSSNTSNGIADVLLITVTDTEAQAIFDLFPHRSKKVIDGRIYYDLGIVGSVKTFMAQSTGTGYIRARICIEASIQALFPKVVIMVGIAFGLCPEKQKIGDILVSQQIENYDQRKIGTGPDEQQKIYARGDRVQASERLLNRFMAGRHEWQAPPAIHFGLILSGSILIGNKDFRDELHHITPDAIGGEMEGNSLYEVGNHKHVEWVLVKAICDWADAGKNDTYQMLAARNAARFVIQVVGQEQFVDR